jgi:hypothetical protein
MVLNLYMVKTSPSLVTRFWRKKAGPREVNRIVIAITAIRGRARSSTAEPTTKSRHRFDTAPVADSRGGVTANEVTPSIDWMESLWVRTSERFVETLTSAGVFLQASGILRISSG